MICPKCKHVYPISSGMPNMDFYIVSTVKIHPSLSSYTPTRFLFSDETGDAVLLFFGRGFGAGGSASGEGEFVKKPNRVR